MAHALRRKPHIWHNVGRYNPVIVIGSDFVWVSIMKPHLSLAPGHQHYTVLEMDKGNSRSTWLHNSYSVTNSTGATQHFSANHKTNSEQKNRSSFTFGPITNEGLAVKSCLFPSTKRQLIINIHC